MPRNVRIVTSVVAAAMIVGSCSSPAQNRQPTPGALKLRLNSPNSTDAAILIRLDGAEMSNVVVSGGGRAAYVRTISATRIVVAIVGPVTSGEQLRFDVPDTRRSADYVATVLEVSDDSNALRATPSAYTLTVQR